MEEGEWEVRLDSVGSQGTWLMHSVFSITETHGPCASSLLGLGIKMQSCPCAQALGWDRTGYSITGSSFAWARNAAVRGKAEICSISSWIKMKALCIFVPQTCGFATSTQSRGPILRVPSHPPMGALRSLSLTKS